MLLWMSSNGVVLPSSSFYFHSLGIIFYCQHWIQIISADNMVWSSCMISTRTDFPTFPTLTNHCHMLHGSRSMIWSWWTLIKYVLDVPSWCILMWTKVGVRSSTPITMYHFPQLMCPLQVGMVDWVVLKEGKGGQLVWWVSLPCSWMVWVDTNGITEEARSWNGVCWSMGAYELVGMYWVVLNTVDAGQRRCDVGWHKGMCHDDDHCWRMAVQMK